MPRVGALIKHQSPNFGSSDTVDALATCLGSPCTLHCMRYQSISENGSAYPIDAQCLEVAHCHFSFANRCNSRTLLVYNTIFSRIVYNFVISLKLGFTTNFAIS